MPAKNLRRVAEGGSYIHVYNRGIENKVIFADGDDYNTFLNYLEEYLSARKTPEQHKTEFTVKGKTFQGVPHQPKNYHNKVELVAYSLKPDHFHIIVHQKEGKSLQAFLRSLCTRYSIYFNKKYNRTGPLFEGPYKSAHLKDTKDLKNLINYLHTDTYYSSYAHHRGERSAHWVKTNIVLSATEDQLSKETNNNHYEFGKELHNQEALRPQNTPLERRDLQAVTLKPWSRFPEMLFASIILFLLLGLSLRNMAIDGKIAPQAARILGISTTSTNTQEQPQVNPGEFQK